MARAVAAGERDKRITFLEKEVDAGSGDRTWTEIANTEALPSSVWASVMPTTSRERYIYGLIDAEVDYTIFCLYRADITSENRILYKGQELEIIKPPINHLEEDTDLLIFARAAGRDGNVL